MKTIFVVTSSLIPTIGIFTPEERLKQTLETIQSIRNKSPNSFIILSDISTKPLDETYSEIVSKVDLFINLSKIDFLMQLSVAGLKSQSECVMTHFVMDYLQSNPKLLDGVDRIFKITGRIQLDDGFDINEYDGLTGKYVFKKRVDTWMKSPIYNATHIFDTRLYSFCTSLLNYHNETLEKVFQMLDKIDLEHAFFAVLDKSKVVEFDRVYCRGQVASTGDWKID